MAGTAPHLLLALLLAALHCSCAWGKALEEPEPVSLTATTLDATIQALPADGPVLVEFYASWCGACQHFAPKYQQVAAFFGGNPRPKPHVWVGRVDCATQSTLCNRFGVTRYPTLRLGRPAAYARGSEGNLADYGSGAREAQPLVAWVGEQLGATYAFKGKPLGKKADAVPSSPAAQVEKAFDEADVLKATLLAFRRVFEAGAALRGLEQRQALDDWTDLVANAHPLPKCRAGAQQLQAKLPVLWPADEDSPRGDLASVAVCGDLQEPEEWGACRGSTPDARGYTCGLWGLLHALAARVRPERGGAFWLTGTAGFVRRFFKCADCSRHFSEMAERPEARRVSSGRDAVLWAWRSHNEVNARVGKEEAKSGTGDPQHPKAQWPPAALCPTCRTGDGAWNEEEIVKFLGRYYGGPAGGAGAGGFSAKGLFAGRKHLARRAIAAGKAAPAAVQIGALLLVVVGLYMYVTRQRRAAASSGLHRTLSKRTTL